MSAEALFPAGPLLVNLAAPTASRAVATPVKQPVAARWAWIVGQKPTSEILVVVLMLTLTGTVTLRTRHRNPPLRHEL